MGIFQFRANSFWRYGFIYANKDGCNRCKSGFNRSFDQDFWKTSPHRRTQFMLKLIME